MVTNRMMIHCSVLPRLPHDTDKCLVTRKTRARDLVHSTCGEDVKLLIIGLP